MGAMRARGSGCHVLCAGFIKHLLNTHMNSRTPTHRVCTDSFAYMKRGDKGLSGLTPGAREKSVCREAMRPPSRTISRVS
jgi:hypothetical protein